MRYRIFKQYACGHEYAHETKSKEAYENSAENTNHNSFSISPPRTSLISKLVRSRPNSTASRPKPRYKQIAELCDYCRMKEEHKRENPTPPAPWDLDDVNAQRRQRMEEVLRAGKRFILCGECQRDGQTLDDKQRANFEGLCCLNGKKQWIEAEKLVTVDTSWNSARNSQTQASPRTGPSRDAAAWHSPTTTGINFSSTPGEVSEAKAVKYNSLTQSHTNAEPRKALHLDTGGGRDLVGAARIIHPTDTTSQGTYYAIPEIDYEGWEIHPGTRHGQYPITPPALEMPLPQAQSSQILSQPHQVYTPGAPIRTSTSQTEQDSTKIRYPNETKPIDAKVESLVCLPTELSVLSTAPHPLRNTRKVWRDSQELQSHRLAEHLRDYFDLGSHRSDSTFE